jgi:hypothetical protein
VPDVPSRGLYDLTISYNGANHAWKYYGGQQPREGPHLVFEILCGGAAWNSPSWGGATITCLLCLNIVDQARHG